MNKPKPTHLLVDLTSIMQRYNELNDNRLNLSEYWLGELHGMELILKNSKSKKVSLSEEDIMIKSQDYAEKFKSGEWFETLRKDAYEQAIKDLLT